MGARNHTHTYTVALSCSVHPLPREGLSVLRHSVTNPIRFDFNSITGPLGQQREDLFNELYLEIPLQLEKKVVGVHNLDGNKVAEERKADINPHYFPWNKVAE